MVKVNPRDDSVRKVLRHPSSGRAFPEVGPVDWPNDSFTHRRVLDGDVTIEEEKPAEKSEPQQKAVQSKDK